jgi:hypothetical protein
LSALMLVTGAVVPLMLLKGCEALLFLGLDSAQRLADVPSPDGRCSIVVVREPGLDGEAQHQVLLRRRGEDGLERLGMAGDLGAHEVEVIWSGDSTVACVWLDGTLSFVHDRLGRNPTPLDLIGRPAHRRVSRSDVAAQLQRLRPGPAARRHTATRPAN